MQEKLATFGAESKLLLSIINLIIIIIIIIIIFIFIKQVLK